MAGHYQILLPLLSIFLVRVDLTDLYPLSLKVQLLEVYDGDTVLVSHGTYRFKVRFLKVDAPELNQPFLTTRGGAGELSRVCLENILANERELSLRIEGTDVYKRTLGDINNVSLKLIERGCSTLYTYARFSNAQEKYVYLRALKKAKAQQVGLWHYRGILRPDKWRKFSKRISHQQYQR
jgi:endonuclease YncB( thermonuclease family)